MNGVIRFDVLDMFVPEIIKTSIVLNDNRETNFIMIYLELIPVASGKSLDMIRFGSLKLRFAITVILVSSLLLGCSVSPPYRKADAISGTVVSETDIPIDGAAVLVAWQAHRSNGSTYTLILRTAETGKDGRFTVPAWGPLYTGPEFSIVYAGEPQLFVAASGYFPYWKRNSIGMASTDARGVDLSLYFPPGKIMLTPIKQKVDQGALSDVITMSIVTQMFSTDPKKCIWIQAPEFSKKFAEIEERLGLSNPRFFGQEKNMCSALIGK